MASHPVIKTIIYGIFGFSLGAGTYVAVTGHSAEASTSTTIAHHQTYSVTFRDTESRKTLAPYVAISLKQLNEMPEVRAADITFKVSEKNHLIPVPVTEDDSPCGDANELIFGLRDNVDNVSFARQCDPGEGVAWIDKSYWDEKSLPDPDIHNVITHELGHLLGLHHPESGCDTTTPTRPILCAVLPAYQEGDSIGLFREHDLAAIRNLINDLKGTTSGSTGKH